MRSGLVRRRAIALTAAAIVGCAGLAAVALSAPGGASPTDGASSRSASAWPESPAAAGTVAIASASSGGSASSVPIRETPTAGVTPTLPPAGITESLQPSGASPQGGYYVAATGSDSGTGAEGSPWQSLQAAADRAPTGATIWVRGGTYKPFKLTRTGLTFSGYPGEVATVQGSPAASDAIRIEGVTSATLEYLTVVGNTTQYGSGIRVEASSGVTLSHLVVHDNTSFGVRTNDSSALIEQSEIYLNHTGVEIARSGHVVVTHNDIHDNNKWIDPGVGAQGISFFENTGSVVASYNRLWSNHTLAGDPLGPEGKAFEIYAAANLTITGNVTWDDRQVVETGTDSARTRCTNITFTRNLSYRTKADASMGLILRCADHSLFANNTLVGLDKFAFDISSNYGTYGGSIAGMRILDNLVVDGRTYSIDDAIPSTVVLDYNLAYTTTAATAQYGTYDAWVVGHDQTRSLTTFQAWTGRAAHDVWGSDPLLNSKYCPGPGSPAINAGTSVALTFKGAAPDIGYCEVG